MTSISILEDSATFSRASRIYCPQQRSTIVAVSSGLLEMIGSSRVRMESMRTSEELGSIDDPE